MFGPEAILARNLARKSPDRMREVQDLRSAAKQLGPDGTAQDAVDTAPAPSSTRDGGTGQEERGGSKHDSQSKKWYHTVVAGQERCQNRSKVRTQRGRIARGMPGEKQAGRITATGECRVKSRAVRTKRSKIGQVGQVRDESP